MIEKVWNKLEICRLVEKTYIILVHGYHLCNSIQCYVSMETQ